MQKLSWPILRVQSHWRDLIASLSSYTVTWGSGGTKPYVGDLFSFVYTKFLDNLSVRFFPHEIADLSIVLNYLLMPDGPVQEQSQWALRYIVLLWLSLICMIPFDLTQFDEDDQIGRTAEIIESIGKTYLGHSGLEREGAALSLSRFYTRFVHVRLYGRPHLIFTERTRALSLLNS
jgi:hypothetical protein